MRQLTGKIITLLGSREFRLFILVGIAQFLWDAALFSLLHWWSGLLPLANIAARGSAALLGFALNRYLTFERARRSSPMPQLIRLLMLWVALTLLSTLMLVVWREIVMGATNSHHVLLMSAGKIVTEMLLVLCSFWAARNWVYR